MLRRLGLRTIGRFAALDAPDVLARFGALGADLHRLAAGRERLPPGVTAPPVDLRVSIALDPPIEQVDRAAFCAKSLADTLHRELGSRGLACSRVLVVAETEVGDRIERLWRADGALSAAAISQRVRWQLEGWLGAGRSVSRCTGGITRLELVPDEVRADDGLQLGFWGGTSAVRASSTGWCRWMRSTCRRGRSGVPSRGRVRCRRRRHRSCGPGLDRSRCSTPGGGGCRWVGGD